MLIVVEGLDGAGKRTLTEGLRTAFAEAGKSVATCAFPRYGQSITADLASEALHGAHGDLASSVYAMAVLFALDRAAAREHVAELRRGHDVVILDRYVASNAAYCAARLHQDADGAMVTWVGDLEYGRLGLPEPDRQILLGVPVELAAHRARQRESGDSTGPGTPTNATPACNSAPLRCTRGWPHSPGTVRGRLSARGRGGRRGPAGIGSARLAPRSARPETVRHATCGVWQHRIIPVR